MKLFTLSLMVLVLVACGKENSRTSAQVRTPAVVDFGSAAAESCDGREAGDIFLASDGINTCQCNAKLVAMCTLVGAAE